MYFPYLRGKQFELLALKELSPLLGDQQKVTPIVEPVRASKGSGLDRCLTALTAVQLDFVLVMNPSVGNLRGPLASDDLVDYVDERTEFKRWNLGLLLDEETDVERLLSDYRHRLGNEHRLTLIHRGVTTGLDRIPDLTRDLNREIDVVSRTAFPERRHIRALLSSSHGVTLADSFPGEERNADYLDRPESQFTEEHLYYREENWFGFADFTTIGESYSEGGFTPRAVAIHWTYEPSPGDRIMIRHFTSESNGDTTNVGGKFLEAASKLVAFLDEQEISTRAADVMRDHVSNSTYPGLGIVKKLSIQNHLELVSGILSRP